MDSATSASVRGRMVAVYQRGVTQDCSMTDSGNLEDKPWTHVLGSPWAVRSFTALPGEAAAEQRLWCNLARRARKHWQKENPY